MTSSVHQTVRNQHHSILSSRSPPPTANLRSRSATISARILVTQRPWRTSKSSLDIRRRNGLTVTRGPGGLPRHSDAKESVLYPMIPLLVPLSDGIQSYEFRKAFPCAQKDIFRALAQPNQTCCFEPSLLLSNYSHRRRVERVMVSDSACRIKICNMAERDIVGPSCATLVIIEMFGDKGTENGNVRAR